MENVVKYLDTMDANVRKSRVLTVSALVFCAVVILGSMFMSYRFATERVQSVYVLDQGKSLVALQSQGAATKELEAMDHIKQFHEYFFNLAPNQESIISGMDRAYLLCDGSALSYFNDLSESNFFNRLISNNIIQQISVDSVIVDTKVYPYQAYAYCTLDLIRQSSVTRYILESSCSVINTQRSVGNPHGMMMENFAVTRREVVGQRSR